ncbi:MAG: hypothetical protein GEU74_16440 [Nitriliruptorales bacterium]|nr:hypothetical protein [Nitriliruptorales bacterium]
MTIDVPAAVAFVASNGRVLDRRRLHHLLGDGDAAGVIAALDGYHNNDGGFGWALESDLRSPESQPVAAMHAFEIIAGIAPTVTPRAVELCDWLQRHTIDNNGVPFALPIGNPAGCAPWWKDADTTAPSLHITAAVAAKAHLVARHDPAVASHPWLGATTEWCLERIAGITKPNSHELLFSLLFCEAASDTHPEATGLLEHIGEHLPDHGVVAVDGGIEGEVFHPLDFSPNPGRPLRRLFPDHVIAADLDRLEADQRDDGGWDVNFRSASPVGLLEWRAYATVNAIIILRANRKA